jgi:hypothetical protein
MKTRLILLGYSLLLVGCGLTSTDHKEVINEAVKAAFEVAKDTAPNNPADLTGWATAGGVALATFVGVLIQRYRKKMAEKRANGD